MTSLLARTPNPAVARAFDALASDYDKSWTYSFVGRLQRQQVWHEIEQIFRSDDRVLEIGCGTGADAVRLAARGVRVHATDVSPRMLTRTLARTRRKGLSDRVRCELLSAERLSEIPGAGVFDGALSNFGAFNCVQDLRSAARDLARLLRPGGKLVLCFMGRFCLWETAWYLLRGRPGKAFRRLTGRNDTSLKSADRFTVFYPSRAALRRAFGKEFRLVSLRSIGVLIPPSHLEQWARKHPRFVITLARLDGHLSKWPVFRGAGDHRLAVFLKKDTAGENGDRRRISGKSRGQGESGVEIRSQSPSLGTKADWSGYPIELRCPVCGTAAGSLAQLDSDGTACALCGFGLRTSEGIVRALPADRQRFYARFLREYSSIRRAEGRGSGDAAYYLALPFQDLSGRNADQWAIRVRTYRYFERYVLPQFEGVHNLRILDLGAGNGWLSYRLARRKHQPVAVDILTDPADGLGAAVNYRASLEKPFPLVEAEFDNLPFVDGQFDLAIFNSSLHYSTDYSSTLTEAKRCLKSTGGLVVLDSPIYKRREHGELMREERHREFQIRYGFRSDSISSIEFLYDRLLADLAHSLHLRWKVYQPWYGWKWHIRPWKSRLKRQRPPSRFQILVGELSQ